MSDDLDLRRIDQRHEPDPEFRAALHRRLMAIMDRSDPINAGEAADVTTIELQAARRPAEPRRFRWTTRGAIAIAGAAAIVTVIVIVSSRDDGATPAAFRRCRRPCTPGGSPSPPTGPDGEAYPDEDVYVARVGVPSRRLAGSDTDELVPGVSRLSPDRSQLVFGQAAGSAETTPITTRPS